MNEEKNDLFDDLDDDIDLADIFDEFEKEKAALKERPQVEIAKCCGNCTYFKYAMGSQRRGLCMRNVYVKRNGRKKIAEQSTGDARKDFMRMRDSGEYPKTHITCVCDRHKLTSFSRAIRLVRDYCGISDLRIKDDF